jgi:hypothetical protein
VGEMVLWLVQLGNPEETYNYWFNTKKEALIFVEQLEEETLKTYKHIIKKIVCGKTKTDIIEFLNINMQYGSIYNVDELIDISLDIEWWKK